MIKSNDILIDHQKSLKDAIEKLEKYQSKMLICVDNKKRLLGVLNDGDIRRAFLNGAKLNNKIYKYMQLAPITINDSFSLHEAQKLISKRAMIIPVVKSDGIVKGYYSGYEDEGFQLNSIREKNVTIVGLGYVGLTIACILSEAGYKVYGYDKNKDLVNNLNKKRPHLYEKGLQKYLDDNVNKNLFFVNYLKKSLSSIYLISVGTHLIKNILKPNLEPLKQACRSIAHVLKSNDLVILRSTLPVGSSRKIVIPIIEKITKMKCGKDFYLSFAPERTAEGVALQELKKNPQIVGAFNQISYEKTSSFFNTFTPSVINMDSLEGAEFSKLLDNSFRDHMFSFSNQFIEFAEKSYLNLNDIIKKVNYGYGRNNIPQISPGVGGPCLSKDPLILQSCLEEKKINYALQRKVRLINSLGPLFLKKRIKKLLANCGKNINSAKIFLIGIAFKGEPETSDIRESTSVWFINKFKNKKNIFAYDKRVSKKEINSLGIKYSSIASGFKKADVVIFLNNHKMYRDLNISRLSEGMRKPAVIFDCWNIFDPIEVKQIRGILYGGLGVG